ncbi:MAG: hypothetical protein NT093_01160 [Candidatus Moranbacteria bacterium]|nr:hypothetical protein [Candidatus Moranbacteria bacterium]
MCNDYGKNFKEMDEAMEMGCMEWPKKFKKEFMMAKMKKKEKILEAKLEFLREMRRLAEKSEMNGEKEAEAEEKQD